MVALWGGAVSNKRRTPVGVRPGVLDGVAGGGDQARAEHGVGLSHIALFLCVARALPLSLSFPSTPTRSVAAERTWNIEDSQDQNFVLACR